MISCARASYVRISPRKVRYVIDLIRRKSIYEAQKVLNGSPRRAGLIVSKLLSQALDAAQKNSNVGASQLIVSRVMADGGPSMRRFRAATMGRGMLLKKRTSHIYLELDLKNKTGLLNKPGKTVKAKKEIPAPARPIVVKKQAVAGKKKLAGAK